MCIGVVFFLNSCSCKKYATRFSIDDPIYGASRGYHFPIVMKKNIYGGLAIPRTSEYYIRPYKLPNDSMMIGYWAGMNIMDHKNDTTYAFRIGAGSEFEVGKCKFRILKVEPRVFVDSTTHKRSKPYVLFQLLELPKYCPCENRKLRKFDAQKRKEEQENLDK